MSSALDWWPNPGPQTGFLMCPVPEILYGGAKGGGKSDAIGPKAVKHALTYGEHATVLILRETMPQLRDLIRRVRPHCLRAGATYNKVEKTWTFPNGATIIFGHLSAGCDPYWGQEYTMVVCDEVTRCLADEVDYHLLRGSLRSSHGVPCQMILTSNPGGKGHAWVKARFMGVPPLTVQKDPETGLERVFIPANLGDNPHLPETYRAVLNQLPDAEREAFLYGNWSSFEGTVFNFEPGRHVITWAQFKERTGFDRPPAEWNRFRTYDHGFAHPGACYWYAVDHEGRAYVYREFYTIAKDRNGRAIANKGACIAPRDVARVIKEYSEGERYSASWSGPDIKAEVRQDQAGGVRIESHFEAEGIHFLAWHAGDGSRVAGKQALHQRMAGDEPGIVIIESECPHLLRTAAALEYSKQRPELWDKTSEDHAIDSLTGFCKMRPWAPRKPEAAKGWRERRAAPASDWMTL